MKTITSFVVRTIGFCLHYPWWVSAGAILLAIASVWYTATHFSVNTDINQLLSANSPGRQREIAFEKAFPQFDVTIAVVGAPTPELAQEATAALVAKLKPEKNYFVSVDETQGDPFFAQNGLLFVPTEQLQQQTSMLSQAQRLIQVLAGDPSLRGVIKALQYGLLGVLSCNLRLYAMVLPLTHATRT